ncbi:unnamed protein product [Sphagnum troendelagicum]|uniref:Uncharacterized protein n=1 Tax=Sphagnum troendelagicum TaxID=128251 RepID=A0ABP0URD5_9BRYO
MSQQGQVVCQMIAQHHSCNQAELRNSKNGNSQNGLLNSFHHDRQGMQLEDALPFTLLQSDGMPQNDQELHSTVSEVIDRVDSQEMKSNTELRSFDDSSFFTFPSQDGVLITSSQASNRVKGVECTDLIMEVDKHVLEAAHCFHWIVTGV